MRDQSGVEAGKFGPEEGALLAVEYDTLGEEVAPGGPDRVARKVTDEGTGSVKYYVLKATSGHEAGQLFDPQRGGERRQVRPHNGRFCYEMV